jgi:glycosyltransferase involved in cell wall biosynthesis
MPYISGLNNLSYSMTRNILILTQKVDAEDDLLGFFVDWIREFSTKFDKVFVITLAKGSYELPSNVFIYSLGKEKNSSKIVQLFNFYRFLFKLTPQVSGIFAHMSPIFVIASWPVAFLFRKKIILWYLHRSVTFKLKLAEKLSYKIVTAAKESLKFKSDKIIETGHGININKFKPEFSRSNLKDGASRFDLGELKILSVGRISRIKNYDTLIETAKILKEKGVDFEIKIIGKPVMPKDHYYLKSLQLLVTNYQLQNTVHFVGFVPHDRIVEYYKNSDIVIGLTPDGGIDKTILEGMASGCLVLTSNNANRKYFGSYADHLIFEHGNYNDLADKIIALKNKPQNEKIKIINFLINSVINNHRLENVIKHISSFII